MTSPGARQPQHAVLGEWVALSGWACARIKDTLIAGLRRVDGPVRPELSEAIAAIVGAGELHRHRGSADGTPEPVEEPSQSPSDSWLTSSEIAEHAGMSESYVRRLCRAEKAFPAAEKRGGTWMAPATEVVAFFAMRSERQL